MKIWVDADACPKAIKDILVRAAERTGIHTAFIANQWMTLPLSDTVSFEQVGSGLDVADDKIADECNSEDLVITADIPLALRAVNKGALALDPRGTLYDSNNIGQISDMRNFMSELREDGVQTGGPKPFSQRDTLAFANALNKILTKA